MDPKAHWVTGSGAANEGHIEDSVYPGNTSPRILKIAFFDDLGKDTVTVTNFGSVFLESMGKGEDVNGRLIKITSKGEGWLANSDPNSLSGVLKVKLVQ
jgi:hypothetical protein